MAGRPGTYAGKFKDLREARGPSKFEKKGQVNHNCMELKSNLTVSGSVSDQLHVKS
jgi:hypothetical protein